MNDFLPNDEPGLADWFENWSNKMDDHGAEHGFSPTEIQQSKDDAMIVRNIVSGWQAIAAYRSEYSRFKKIVVFGKKDAATPDYPLLDTPALPALNGRMMAGIVKRTRSCVRRLNESARFNEAVAADFRVLPNKPNLIAASEAQPALKLQTVNASLVEATFKKNGFVGIELEMQRGETNLWTSLARVYGSPAEDPTPPTAPATPEVRRYRARYLKGNKLVGNYSDIVALVTKP